MSLENFQVSDNELFDNSIKKRDFTKVYHQQKPELNQPNQNNEFFVGENSQLSSNR